MYLKRLVWPHDPANLLLGIYSGEIKHVLLHTCIQIFTAAVFVIAKAKGNPMSINMLIDKHLYDGLLLSNKKEYNNMDESQNNFAE